MTTSEFEDAVKAKLYDLTVIDAARERFAQQKLAVIEVDRAVSGEAFIFDRPDLSEQTLWGSGNDVLWPDGEAVMVASVQGLGKTTLGGQVLEARLFGGEVLGLPVKKLASDRKILYLSMDRPKQAARSLARQFTEEQREELRDRLVVWPGPPPGDFAADPSLLARMAADYNVAEVYLDSLKDAALGLSSDETGAAYNRARQLALRDGVNLFEMHHNVKRNPAGGMPSAIADIYGSTWLTSGCGSVLLLVGEPGDLVVKLKHVKPAVEEVGPWEVLIDKDTGQLSRMDDGDAGLLQWIRAAPAPGVNVREFVVRWMQKKKPTASDIEKGRRRLRVWVKTEGLIEAVDAAGVTYWSYPFGFSGEEQDV